MDKHRFVAIRKGQGLTQAELAEKIGVSPGYIGDIERGYRHVSLNLAMKLEAATEIPVVAEYLAAKSGQAA
jgi:transcriptional regulator with XRE-family HTH domain